MKQKHILIAAGGTGGHIFPALSVARALQAQGATVSWIGNAQSMESRITSQEDLSFYPIQVQKLRSGSRLKKCLFPFILAKALWQSVMILHRLKPTAVLGMGGFVSGPAGIGALLLRIPLVIHEQNAVPGLTNRYLAPFATHVLQSFPQTFATKISAVTTGNPTRTNLNQVTPLHHKTWVPPQKLKLLILGGSQGAHFINQLTLALMPLLTAEERPQIWHQTGHADMTMVKAQYAELGMDTTVSAFIENMADAYEFADVIVSRAGATTIAELTMVGRPAILIPYPSAVDDHQTRNATFLSQAQAAWLEPQNHFTPENFAVLWRKLWVDHTLLISTAQRAYTLRNSDAAEKVAQICLQDN